MVITGQNHPDEPGTITQRISLYFVCIGMVTLYTEIIWPIIGRVRLVICISSDPVGNVLRYNTAPVSQVLGRAPALGGVGPRLSIRPLGPTGVFRASAVGRADRPHAELTRH